MKQPIKSQKGFTITEVLLALLIISMTSVMLTRMLSFSMSSTSAFSVYNDQQFTVNTASIRLGKDIERAIRVSAADNINGNEWKTIELTFESGSCSWKLDGGSLFLDGNKTLDGLTDDSKFILSNDLLCVVLVPEKTSSGKYNINIAKPIVTQYDLKYKK